MCHRVIPLLIEILRIEILRIEILRVKRRSAP